MKYLYERLFYDFDFYRMNEDDIIEILKKQLKNPKYDINHLYPENETLLIMSSYNHRTYRNLFNFLLKQKNIDVNVQNDHDCTALCYTLHNQYNDASRALIHHGADVNIINDYGESSLIITALKQNFSMLKTLIDSGADWDYVDFENRTFLDYLDSKNEKKIISRYPEKYKRFLRMKKANDFNI